MAKSVQTGGVWLGTSTQKREGGGPCVAVIAVAVVGRRRGLVFLEFRFGLDFVWHAAIRPRRQEHPCCCSMYDDVLNVDEPTATAYRQHPSPPAPPFFCASSSKKKEGNKSGKQGAKGQQGN